MRHFYERNITDIKFEYTEHLKDILTPLLYEGIFSLYKVSLHKHKQANATPGAHILFQQCLKDLKNMSNARIEQETNRIKSKSNCADSFDNIVRSVIKSYIVLLTYNCNSDKIKLVDKRYHERIDINTFIHKCYMACASNLYYSPELFRLDDESLEFRKNQRMVLDIIRGSIRSAIMSMLPMQLLTKEYLSNDYIHHETETTPLVSDASLSGGSYINIDTTELLKSSETITSTTLPTETAVSSSLNIDDSKQKEDLSKITTLSTIDNIQNDLDAINDSNVINAYKEVSAKSESVFMKPEPKIKMINAVVDNKAKQLLEKEIVKFNEKHNPQPASELASALLSVSSATQEYEDNNDDDNSYSHNSDA